MSLIFALPGNDPLAASLVQLTGWARGSATVRRFPDGESYVRVNEDVRGRDVAVVASLARPDGRFLRLVFLARLLRDLGASSVTLIAPYLPYLRQDARFRGGEAITSVYFASLLSPEFDRLITIDPHLHRYTSLSEIYSIPAEALSVAPLFARWISERISDPLLVGPDSESEQWVAEVARLARAPHVVMSKRRSGDQDVEVVAPVLERWAGRRPVLIDDIVSSGATLAAAARRLVAQGFSSPYCLIVHALLGRRAEAALRDAGCTLVSTDTVPHSSNRLAVAPLIAARLTNSVTLPGG